MKAYTQVSLAVLVALAGRAAGQTVEFRIVQESATTNSTVTAIPPGQQGTQLNAGNTSGNFAVQARMTAGPNGTALAGFSFDIVIPGELDSSGTPARLRIQNSDGTYWNGAATTIGLPGYAGIAHQFGSLANITADFNGVINTSSGTFTNTPGNQEIGLVTGHAGGPTLTATPGMDPAGEGNPVTWSGYGQTPVGVPNQDDLAAIPAGLGGPYFAQGQFIDVYRFRYTTTFFSNRLLTLSLQNVTAEAFSQMVFSGGVWGSQATSLPGTSITVTPLQVSVVPSPAAIGALAVAGMLAARRRRGTR